MKLLTTRFAKLTADFPRDGHKPYSPELYNTFREILFLLESQNVINTDNAVLISNITPLPGPTSNVPDWSRLFLVMGA